MIPSFIAPPLPVSGLLVYDPTTPTQGNNYASWAELMRVVSRLYGTVAIHTETNASVPPGTYDFPPLVIFTANGVDWFNSGGATLNLEDGVYFDGLKSFFVENGLLLLANNTTAPVWTPPDGTPFMLAQTGGTIANEGTEVILDASACTVAGVQADTGGRLLNGTDDESPTGHPDVGSYELLKVDGGDAAVVGLTVGTTHASNNLVRGSVGVLYNLVGSVGAQHVPTHANLTVTDTTFNDLKSLASNMLIDNTGTGLSATNVQEAIAELAAAAGSGDVAGPGSAVSGHLATFADTTGKVIADGGAPPTGTNTGDETADRIATLTHAATGKSTPVDADELFLVDSAASNVGTKLTWANVKATAKTYFDTLYMALLGGSNDDFAQRKSGAWTYRTPAQVMADLMPLMSGSFSVPVLTKPSGSSGTWGITAGSNAVYVFSSSTSNTDYIEWANIPIAAGTYTVRPVYLQGSGNGKMRLAIDGSSIGAADFDTYAASGNAPTSEDIAGVSIAASGFHTVRLSTPTKNVSSSTYVARLVAITFLRTA